MQVCDSCGGSLEAAAATATTYASGFEVPSVMAPGGFPLPLGPKGPESVGRLVVESLGSPAWRQQQTQQQPELAGDQEDEAMWRGVARMVMQLRMAVQDTRCAAVVSCQACECPWG